MRFISQSGMFQTSDIGFAPALLTMQLWHQAVIPDASCCKRLKCYNGTRLMRWPHSPNRKTNQCSKRFCLIITLQLFHMLMSPTFSSKHTAFIIPTTKIWLLMMPYLNEQGISLPHPNPCGEFEGRFNYIQWKLKISRYVFIEMLKSSNHDPAGRGLLLLN